jgi:hypothetical protein
MPRATGHSAVRLRGTFGNFRSQVQILLPDHRFTQANKQQAKLAAWIKMQPLRFRKPFSAPQCQ